MKLHETMFIRVQAEQRQLSGDGPYNHLKTGRAGIYDIKELEFLRHSRAGGNNGAAWE